MSEKILVTGGTGVLGQPVDAGEVAKRLVELAGRVPDIGGPDVGALAGVARTYLVDTGLRRRILEVPVPGKTARSFRDGALVCPENAYGEIRWQDFLRSRLEHPGKRLQPIA